MPVVFPRSVVYEEASAGNVTALVPTGHSEPLIADLQCTGLDKWLLRLQLQRTESLLDSLLILRSPSYQLSSFILPRR